MWIARHDLAPQGRQGGGASLEKSACARLRAAILSELFRGERGAAVEFRFAPLWIRLTSGTPAPKFSVG